LKVKRQLV